jgi:hypothetical protein
VDSDYPLLSVFLYMLWFFLFVLWLFLLFSVVTDIFRSQDLSGWGKAAWTIFVIVLPLIGLLAYLIVRGDSMHERSARAAMRQEEMFRDYVRDVAASSSPADDLNKLAGLRDAGVITPEEFEREKVKILARS